MDSLEPFPGNVRVDLRGTDIHMPQHDLDGPEVSPAFQEMTGKGMAKGVRGNMVKNMGLPGVLFEALPEALSRHGFP